jgi:hypothetical protein
MQRIALLPEEMGEALDALGASLREARFDAHGFSRLIQAGRLDHRGESTRSHAQKKSRSVTSTTWSPSG